LLGAYGFVQHNDHSLAWVEIINPPAASLADPNAAIQQ
jgi:hypothetical protein